MILEMTPVRTVVAMDKTKESHLRSYFFRTSSLCCSDLRVSRTKLGLLVSAAAWTQKAITNEATSAKQRNTMVERRKRGHSPVESVERIASSFSVAGFVLPNTALIDWF